MRTDPRSVVGGLVNRALQRRIDLEDALKEAERKGLLEQFPESQAKAQELIRTEIGAEGQAATPTAFEIEQQQSFPVGIREQAPTPTPTEERVEPRTFFFNVDIEEAKQKAFDFGESAIGKIETFRTKATEFFLPSLREEREEREREFATLQAEEAFVTQRITTFGEEFGGRALPQKEFEEAILQKESIGKQIVLVENLQFRVQEREKAREIKLIESQFTDPLGVIGGGFAKGFISAPFDIASLGVGLATAPISTVKETFAGFAQIPGGLSEKPITTLSELAGSFTGQTLIFGGRPILFKGKKTQVIKTPKGESIVSISVGQKFDDFGRAIIGFETKTGRAGAIKQITFGKTDLGKTFGVGEIAIKPGGKKTQSFIGVIESKAKRTPFDLVLEDVGGVKVSKEIFGEAIVGKGQVVISPKSKFFSRQFEFGFDRPDILTELPKPRFFETKVRGIKSTEFESTAFSFPVDKSGRIKTILGGTKAEGIAPVGFSGLSFDFSKFKIGDLKTFKKKVKKPKKTFDILTPEQQLLIQGFGKTEIDLLGIASQATTSTIKQKSIVTGKTIVSPKVKTLIGGAVLTQTQIKRGQGLFQPDLSQSLRFPSARQQGINFIGAELIIKKEKQRDILGQGIIQSLSLKESFGLKGRAKTKQIIDQIPKIKTIQKTIQRQIPKQKQKTIQKLALKEIFAKPLSFASPFAPKKPRPFLFRLPELRIGDIGGDLFATRKTKRTPSLSSALRLQEFGIKRRKFTKRAEESGLFSREFGIKGLEKIDLGSLLGKVTRKKKRGSKLLKRRKTSKRR